MNIHRAGKQQKAQWQSAELLQRKLAEEGAHHLVQCDVMRGHAAGWIAGVAWAKRQQAKDRT